MRDGWEKPKADSVQTGPEEHTVVDLTLEEESRAKSSDGKESGLPDNEVEGHVAVESPA
ncbi:hypothetical protein HK104_003223, partial [Borealophlyctis nickersoniae]